MQLAGACTYMAFLQVSAPTALLFVAVFPSQALCVRLCLPAVLPLQRHRYAFGITMWEVVTAGRPFKGMPLISLGHNIAVQGMRPQWPIAVPLRYRMLAEHCWAHAPEERPTMDTVVAQLTEMRAEAGGSTPCVNMSYHQVRCIAWELM